MALAVRDNRRHLQLGRRAQVQWHWKLCHVASRGWPLRYLPAGETINSEHGR